MNVYYESLNREKSECCFTPIELKSVKNNDLPAMLFLIGLGKSEAAELYKKAFRYYPDELPSSLAKK